MAKSKLKATIASFVILVSCLVLFFFYRNHPPFDPLPHQAVGEAIAAEVRTVLAPGGQVILILRDRDLYESPAVETQESTLRRSLEKAGIKVSATNYIKLDPLRAGSVPSGDYVLILKRATERDVVVSLLGLPVLSRDQRAQLPATGPKVVALCVGPSPLLADLPNAFQEGLIHAAVVDRFAAMRDRSSRDPRQVFDSLYQVVNASSVAEWAQARKTSK